MVAQRLEVMLWLLAFSAGGLGLMGWTMARIAPVASRDAVSARVALVDALDADALQAAVDSVVHNDPFRFEHRPASVPFALRAETLSPVAPPVPRPKLAVVGIIGGPPWEAIVDGIPGRDGSVVVRQGDIAGPLQFISVKRDTVVVRGADTTWRLTLRRSW
jgi:hypothetical protein